jgi:hypothetical protein
MTIEERKLLLKDLCYRSPYNVIIYIIGIGNKVLNYIDLEDEFVNCAPLETIRPYLRSMSSMTDDEKTELFQLMGNGTDIQRIDFYNSHYFDYRCLIDKNLALEAPEGMYNISGSGLRVRLKSGEIIEVVKNDDFCAAKYLNKETTEYIFDEDIEEIIK